MVRYTTSTSAILLIDLCSLMNDLLHEAPSETTAITQILQVFSKIMTARQKVHIIWYDNLPLVAKYPSSNFNLDVKRVT